jgi:hypothetical protein
MQIEHTFSKIQILKSIETHHCDAQEVLDFTGLAA